MALRKTLDAKGFVSIDIAVVARRNDASQEKFKLSHYEGCWLDVATIPVNVTFISDREDAGKSSAGADNNAAWRD
jgi:lipocalin